MPALREHKSKQGGVCQYNSAGDLAFCVLVVWQDEQPRYSVHELTQIKEGSRRSRGKSMSYVDEEVSHADFTDFADE